MESLRIRTWLIGAVLFLVLMGVSTWVLHEYYTTHVPGANDFFSRWAGAHLYFTRGVNPYSQEASLWIQQAIYGRAALPTEDASLFAYPFYTVFLIVPFAFMPYDWAQAAWQVTLLVIVVTTVLLLLAYYRWKPKPATLGLLMVWSLIFYPTARSLILGQLGLLVYALTIAILWLLFRASQPCARCDIWAGVLLAITTIKPQMQFLIIPLLLLWALHSRRWMFIGAFVGMALSLVLLSFILIPSWLEQWIMQVQQYPEYTPPAVLYILTHEILPLGNVALIVERFLEGAVVIYLLLEWWLVLRVPVTARRMDWVIGLTLICTHLIAPRTATTHFVVFTFLLFALIRDVRHQGMTRVLILIGGMLILLIGMWWLFLATLEGNQEANIVHLPLPLLFFIIALIVRPRQHTLRAEPAS